MALTRSEAEERATRIWGEQVSCISEKSWRVGDWWITLFNGSLHYLDSNGHAACHPECADIEVIVCP